MLRSIILFLLMGSGYSNELGIKSKLNWVSIISNYYFTEHKLKVHFVFIAIHN
jgi:hypothetical protein